MRAAAQAVKGKTMAKMNRRVLLGAPLLAALAADAVGQQQPGSPQQGDRTPAPATARRPAIASGPFQSTADSLKNYQAPDWFRDAKFGIWAHWGPQAVPRSGDWYARWMYVPGHWHYDHHLKHFGHPSKAGYKD